MSTYDQVVEIIGKKLQRDPGEFTPDTNLEEEGVESLDVIEITFELEETFHIDIPLNANDTNGVPMRTIGEIVTLVDKLKAEQSKS
jgi:acyl carrier protein